MKSFDFIGNQLNYVVTLFAAAYSLASIADDDLNKEEFLDKNGNVFNMPCRLKIHLMI